MVSVWNVTALNVNWLWTGLVLVWAIARLRLIRSEQAGQTRVTLDTGWVELKVFTIM